MKRNVRSVITNNRTGSSFDSWLQQEGIYEEDTAAAIMRVLVSQLATEMQKQ